MKVRDVLGMLAEDGWYLDRTRGNHRQYSIGQNPGWSPYRASLTMILSGHTQYFLRQADLKK